MNRRELLAAGAVLAASHAFGKSTQPATASTKPAVPDDVVWHDVRDWGVEGRGFVDTENYFDRLPARAKGIVRDDVWNLSRQTAGMSARFATDSEAIYVRYAVTKSDLAMPHMPASGVSGVDLYAMHDNKWHWLATHSPRSDIIKASLVQHILPGKRGYLLNLPLYNGVTSLEIGVEQRASFAPIAPRKDKPILFYGTSITQGGCASRPGMAFVNILGRRLDRPVLNFGFSGNGRMEFDVAKFLAELDAAIFVLDCSANMNGGGIAWRVAPLVKILREKQPKMPILLLDERVYASSPLTPSLVEVHAAKSTAMKKACDDLVAAGDTNIFFRGDEHLIGDDSEGTVDGSHPTDLGMMRYADALEPELRKILSAV